MKSYEKPVLTKRERLSLVTAGGGSGNGKAPV